MSRRRCASALTFTAAAFAVAALTAAAGGCAKDPVYPDADGGALCSAPATGTGDTPQPTTTGCDQSCNAANGVAVGCATRFLYGVNYAWNGFAGDFGGVPGAARGVSQDCSGKVVGDLRDMRAHGVDVVRWWVWPQFRGNGVAFVAAGVPTGLGSTTLADIQAALTAAALADVHVQFCFFSFDNFRMDLHGGIKPIVTDAAKRAALMQNVIAPFVQAVVISPYADRAVSWDIINEPEWAITGSNGYGDPPYTPQTNLMPVTQAEMEQFVAETIATIRGASGDRPLPITVGSAGAKWPKAWSHVDVDYYTIHIYDWLNRQFPYDRTPAELGLTGKPVMMGEFPLNGLTGVTYAQLLAAWKAKGYAGALGWAVTDRSFNWPVNKLAVKEFADGAGCEIRY